MRVFLTGFMGAGKSSVGRLVGELLHLPFVDLDGYIEEQAGRPIAEIFSDVGEVGFRALESEALVEIAQLSGVVVSDLLDGLSGERVGELAPRLIQLYAA